jgi:hypothetical protein
MLRPSGRGLLVEPPAEHRLAGVADSVPSGSTRSQRDIGERGRRGSLLTALLDAAETCPLSPSDRAPPLTSYVGLLIPDE